MNFAVAKPHGALRLPTTVNSLFDQLLAEAVASPVRPSTKTNLLPAADVVETAAAFELYLHLPGFRKEDVSLDLENGKLTVKGERKPEPTEGRSYRLIESQFGPFERSFRLPEIVDITQVTATLDLGILTISLPKDAQKTAKHQIAIQ